MKRVLVLILSILYITSATGATVNMHYCMGKLIGTSIDAGDNELCHKCGMKKGVQKKSCCKDEHKTYKTADHQYAKITFDLHSANVALPVVMHSYFPFSPVAECTVTDINRSHAPPSYWRNCPIYTELHNFRI